MVSEAQSKKAGVNVGTLYRYFENKNAVFISMLHEQIAQLFANYESLILNGEGRRSRRSFGP